MIATETPRKLENKTLDVILEARSDALFEQGSAVFILDEIAELKRTSQSRELTNEEVIKCYLRGFKRMYDLLQAKVSQARDPPYNLSSDTRFKEWIKEKEAQLKEEVHANGTGAVLPLYKAHNSSNCYDQKA